MWLYEQEEITQLSDLGDTPPFGFIYIITNLTNGKFYIGKKQILSYQNKKLGKRELATLKEERKTKGMRGKCPSKKLVITEKKWVDYWGSNDELLEDIQELGIDAFDKEIIRLCYDKKQLTYWEMHLQCQYNVLMSDNCYNDNILGKFFTQDLINQ